MYYLKLFNHVEIFVIGDKIAGREVRVAEAGRRSIRHGDDFNWL